MRVCLFYIFIMIFIIPSYGSSLKVEFKNNSHTISSACKQTKDCDNADGFNCFDGMCLQGPNCIITPGCPFKGESCLRDGTCWDINTCVYGCPFNYTCFDNKCKYIS